MNKPKLMLLVGLSGSGKSTIAQKLAEENPNTVIVSLDAIREELTGKVEDQTENEEVFKIFHNRIRKNLENKKECNSRCNQHYYEVTQSNYDESKWIRC